MDISLIIFCYNERQSIEAVVQAAQRVAGQLAQSFEIIVVDDGSVDGTAEALKHYSDIIYIRHPVNAGIGSALRTGYAAATREYVCAIPGDGQFDVSELLQVQPFGKRQFYSFYRRTTNYNAYRRLLSLFNRLFNLLLLGLNMNDVNWIKVYRNEQLQFVQAELKSSIVESEICAKLVKSGCVPVELPSVYGARRTGAASGGNWKTLRKALSEMWALYRVVRNFKKPFTDIQVPLATHRSKEQLNLKQGGHARS